MQPRPNRGTRRSLLTSVCLCLAAATTTQAVPPANPTNLRAFIPAPTVFQLRWLDNSTDETGFRIAYNFDGSTGTLDLGSSTGTGQVSVNLDPQGATNGSFAIRALKGTELSTLATNQVIVVFKNALSAPTLLTATAGSPAENSALLDFSDNNGANTHYSYEYRRAGSGAWAVLATSVDTASINLTGLLAPGTAYDFQCRAVASGGGTTVYSNYSNTASLTTPFNAPSGLAGTPQSDGSVRLTWTDNSQAEGGVAVYTRRAGSGNFALWNYAAANATTFTVTGLAPATAYDFQIAAAFDRGTTAVPDIVESARSQTAAAATLPLSAPSGLTATPQSESSVGLTWIDNSQAEQGVAVYFRRAGSGSFVLWNYSAANATTYTVTGLAPGTAYEFQVAAAFDRGTPTVPDIIESARSATAAATTPFHAPSGLTATTQSDSAIGLTWTDNSPAEQGVAVYRRLAGVGSFVLVDYTAANATTYTVTGLDPATAYDFQVAAAFERGESGQSDIVESARSATATATTRDAITSAPFAPITFGQPFTYQLTTTSGSPRTSWAATGLPAPLTFNPTTGAVSGTPSVSGLFTVNLSATFANGWTANRALTLRITRPPAAPTVTTPLPVATTLTMGSPAATYQLEPVFADPDSQSAVRLATTLGPLDLLLYDAQTPATVTNFLGYLDRDDFDNSAFHRLSSAADSGVVVLQGGQLKPTTAGADTFTPIATQPAVINEPGISNQPLTIAMAKSGGDPNSATSQFYFNLDSLNTVLDPPSQNGGFTVFGRVSLASAAVLQALATSPVGGPYQILIDGASQTLPFSWPLNVPSPAEAPATMDNTKIMTILTAQRVATLNLDAVSSQPTVATASVNAGVLLVTPLAPGQATITVTATDLDGMSAVQSITVTVTGTYQQWAEALPPDDRAPGANPDGDDSDNLLEYALLTDPEVPDAAALAGGVDGADAGRRATITFPVRKFAPDLVYRVYASATLATGDWTEVWNSTQGFADPAVIAADNQADRTVVTVRDPTAGQPQRFLRVLVEQAP